MNAVRENPNVISGGNIGGFETDNPLLKRTDRNKSHSPEGKINKSTKNTKELVQIIKDLKSDEKLSKDDMRRFSKIDKKLALELIEEEDLQRQETIKE